MPIKISTVHEGVLGKLLQGSGLCTRSCLQPAQVPGCASAHCLLRQQQLLSKHSHDTATSPPSSQLVPGFRWGCTFRQVDIHASWVCSLLAGRASVHRALCESSVMHRAIRTPAYCTWGAARGRSVQGATCQSLPCLLAQEQDVPYRFGQSQAGSPAAQVQQTSQDTADLTAAASPKEGALLPLGQRLKAIVTFKAQQPPRNVNQRNKSRHLHVPQRAVSPAAGAPGSCQPPAVIAHIPWEPKQTSRFMFAFLNTE